MTKWNETSQSQELCIAVAVERSGNATPTEGFEMSNHPIRITARSSANASNLAIDPVLGSSFSSLADVSESIEFNLFETLDGLINDWCERRALSPLRYLLRAYPEGLGRTDQQFQLLEALKNLKSRCRDHLTPEELLLVTAAHNFLEERLRTRVI